MTDWQSTFSAPDAGFITDLSPSDDAVLVAFGALKRTMDLGIPPFEFFNLVSELPVGKVFVRDLNQVWYHRGVAGLGGSLSEMAESLGKLVGNHRAVFVGHSSGGYAALLLGALLGVDAVVATSPQTFLSRWLRWRHRDNRWRPNIAAMYKSPSLERQYLDIRPTLLSSTGGTRFEVHYSAKHRRDIPHATRLAEVPNLTLIPHPEPTHSLVRVMRDDGSLVHVLRRALQVG